MKRTSKLAVAALAACALVALVTACGSSNSSSGDSGSGSSGSTASGDSPYQVYFSINFTGNAQRQQIMRTMKLATEKGPLAGKAELTISTSQNTVTAQAQDISNIISRKPDAIVVIPSSETGLNAAITRACSAGITVVAIDSPVTASCAYNVDPDAEAAATAVGEWLGEQSKGKSGTVLVDQGIPGLPIAEQIYNGFVKGMEATNAGIGVADFQGEFAPGPEKSGVTNLLSAHRSDLLGIAAVSYLTAVQSAVKEAGLEPVPTGAATALNGDTLACLSPKQPCFMFATPMTEGAEALKLAVELLEGTADASEKQITLTPEFLTNDKGATGNVGAGEAVLIEEGVNAFPELPPDLSLPYKTEWLNITPQEAAG